MKKIIIFHGTLGSPDSNWFPWLQDHLMFDEHQVAVPKMPTPEEQTLGTWIQALKAQISGFADADILIGHSLGATLILHLLQQNLVTPQKTILVSPVIDKIDNEEHDTLNHDFIKGKFDWDTIKKQDTDIHLICGDNDPYVPLNQGEAIADNLDITLHLIKDGGHLNAESGFDEFPEILDFIHD